MKTFKYILSALLILGTLTSCEKWFDQAPESEMVFGDFWKKKTDVLSSVGSCYRGLLEEGVIKRLIVWGEVRSDNVIPGKSTEDNLSYILSANINAANEYAKWGDIYTVINYCNTVISYAPGVRELDPDFPEKELQQYLAEAKAIRAFCYFTLVRTFKNVPYVEEPYNDDSRPFAIAQSTEEEILDSLMMDLRSIENHAVEEYTSIVNNKGRITRKAVWSLMADIALWKNDYQTCIEYCDKILEATTNQLSLERASVYYKRNFFEGNSSESIWELQFDNNTWNWGVRDLYGASDNDAKLTSYDFTAEASASLFATKDIRRINAFVEKDGFMMIKKYVAYLADANVATVRESNFEWRSAANNNWIIYRLADIYLMKAEALAELGDEASLNEAVELVSKTYDRANPDLENGSLIGSYSSQEQVRNLVFDERQREFLFEGKRYFDLVRRMRREGTPTATINAYLIDKYLAMNIDRGTVMSKLNDVDAIYMPIHQEELKVNSLLEQNRFYMTSSSIN